MKITVDEKHVVSGLWLKPPAAVGGLVLAHGAGAGMTHPFLAAISDGLAARRIATLRFQFPAMETGLKRPDRPALAQTTVRAAVAAAAALAPDLPLFAGGKSFGARMTSQAQANEALRNVRGLVFFGFPLHPAKKPSTERAAHLAQVDLPMLFLQGTRDALADKALVEQTIGTLGRNAKLVQIDEADHSFHVPVKTGRSDAQILDAMLDDVSAWIEGLCRQAA